MREFWGENEDEEEGESRRGKEGGEEKGTREKGER